MSFVLTDLSNERHALRMADDSWSPIALEITRSGIVSSDRAQKIEYHMSTQVSAWEARAISVHLSEQLRLMRLPLDIDADTADRVATFAKDTDGFEIR